MKLTKAGKTDKRFKKKKSVKPTIEKQDPNELHDKLLKNNNLKLDFDVLEGTISTKYGIIKLENPTLVIKASYVQVE